MSRGQKGKRRCKEREEVTSAETTGRKVTRQDRDEDQGRIRGENEMRVGVREREGGGDVMRGEKKESSNEMRRREAVKQ